MRTQWRGRVPSPAVDVFGILALCTLSILISSSACSVLNVEKDAGPSSSDNGSGPPKITISKVVFRSDMGPPIPDNCPAYDIWLKNVGGETACGIEATIEGKSDSIYYDCLQSGESDIAYIPTVNFFAICIPAETPPGSALTFTLLIKDDSGHHWEDAFSIEVQ
jgi:hypothetical protein